MVLLSRAVPLFSRLGATVAVVACCFSVHLILSLPRRSQAGGRATAASAAIFGFWRKRNGYNSQFWFGIDFMPSSA